MNKTTRRLVFLAFLGLFLISAPLVVLYTAGYRFNPQKMGLVKTGLLAVSSEPKSATVFIDGVDTEQKTNLILKNVMPGEHLIRLEKEGYWPWEKKLEVRENETTFIQKAELFLSGEPTVKTDSGYLTYTIDPDGKKLAYASITEGWIEIWSRDLSSGEEKLLSRLPSDDSAEISLSWSLFDETLIVKETKNLTAVWRLIKPDGQSDLFSKNPFRVWQRDENQFLFTENYQEQTQLVRRDQLGQEKTLAVIPYGQYEFLPASPFFVLLRDQTREKIVLVDDRGVDQPILLNTTALSAVWNPQNEKQLLYASEFELHIFDAEKISDELLTRLSVPINGATWHAAGFDVLFSDGKNIFVLELDNRGGQRQSWTLTTLDEVKTFAATDDGRTVYAVGTKNGVSAVFEQSLQK